MSTDLPNNGSEFEKALDVVARGAIDSGSTLAELGDMVCCAVQKRMQARLQTTSDIAALLDKKAKDIPHIASRGAMSTARAVQLINSMSLILEELEVLESYSPQDQVTVSELMKKLECDKERLAKICAPLVSGRFIEVVEVEGKKRIRFIRRIRKDALTDEDKLILRRLGAKALHGSNDALFWHLATYKFRDEGILTSDSARRFKKYFQKITPEGTKEKGGLEAIDDIVRAASMSCEQGRVGAANGGVVGALVKLPRKRLSDQELLDWVMKRYFDPDIFFFRSTGAFNPTTAESFFNVQLPQIISEEVGDKFSKLKSKDGKGDVSTYALVIIGATLGSEQS